MKPWKVYFEGSLWGHHQRDHAGREIRVDRVFQWGGRQWMVPAIYVCARGLVMDLCVSASCEAMKAFVEKWSPFEKSGDISEEIRPEIEREHPLRMDVHAELVCNGRRLSKDHASGSAWMPEVCFPEGYRNGEQEKTFVAHYGLDRERAWAFRRIMFPWNNRRGRWEIFSLKLELSEDPVEFSGPSFGKDAEKVTFSHPFTEKEYTLTVIAEQEEEVPSRCFSGEDMEYPRKCLTLRYRVEPPAENVSVRWCGRGDSPRGKTKDRYAPMATCSAVFIMNTRNGDEKSAASALYFELPTQRAWRVTVQEKLVADGAWLILGEEEKSM